MTATVWLDRSNRIMLSRDLRQAAGMSLRQQFNVFATPGRIVLQVESISCGGIVRRDKLSVWTGEVPSTPLATAIERTRHRHYRP